MGYLRSGYEGSGAIWGPVWGGSRIGSFLVNSGPYLDPISGNLIINLRFTLHTAVGRALRLEYD